MDQATLNTALAQASLKVNRAYRHFIEAQDIIGQYLASDLYHVAIERDLETGGQMLRISTAELPPDVALAIGDCFHNLSAALDYLMTGIMRAVRVSTQRVSFPVDDSRQAFRKSFMTTKPGKGEARNRRIVKHVPAFVWLLLTKIKPYRGGNFLLWEIRQADNVDKHNLITPTVAVTYLKGLVVQDETNNSVYGPNEFTIDAGLSFYPFSVGGESRLEIKDKGQAAVYIFFPESSEVFRGQPVLPTLLQCIQAVNHTLHLVRNANLKAFVREKIAHR